jgi:peptidoglycan/LPS O-acetylase OafA/YrhL
VTGRDNNFNLLRFLAASAVLVTHSFALSTGDPYSEPLRRLLEITPGSIAVDIFFVTSGYLVTGSLLARQDILGFFVARGLRIFPALWTAVIATTLCVGLWFTSLGAESFFTQVETWKHVVKNMILVRGVSYDLPGAFEMNPWRGAVNGSLWSLPVELEMYAILAGIWILTGFVARQRAALFAIAAVTVGVVAAAAHLALDPPKANGLIGLTGMFFLGAGLKILKNRIQLRTTVASVMAIGLIVSAFDLRLFFVAYTVFLPYLVIYLAYVPGGWMRKFNRVGDYSYGMYVYAYPVQQAVAACIPGVNPLLMFSIAYPVTLCLSVSSWHLLENRVLRMKDRILRRREKSGVVVS